MGERNLLIFGHEPINNLINENVSLIVRALHWYGDSKDSIFENTLRSLFYLSYLNQRLDFSVLVSLPSAIAKPITAYISVAVSATGK